MIHTRCNTMLPNHCQCPNNALGDSDICLLHTRVKEAETKLNKVEPIPTVDLPDTTTASTKQEPKLIKDK